MGVLIVLAAVAASAYGAYKMTPTLHKKALIPVIFLPARSKFIS